MENKQIHNPTRSELITDFVKSNPEYYIKEFQLERKRGNYLDIF